MSVIFCGSRSARRRLRRSSGFTIVEVMMAAIILVVGFMGMIQAITLGSEMMATARRQTLAAQILEHEIGKLRLTSWSNLPSAGTYAYPNPDPDSHFAAAISACGLITANLTVSRTTTDLTSDLKEVSFTLTWTKSGSNSAADASTGSWLDQLAFSRPSVIARTYTRKSTAYFGKYGLNLSMQRS